MGRLTPIGVTDTEAVDAFRILSRSEGIIPALESAHALSAAIKIARDLPKDKVVLVNLSGRGDKDVENVVNNLMEDAL